jgi:hypothetical protein
VFDIDVLKCPGCPFYFRVVNVLTSAQQVAVYCHIKNIPLSPPVGA